ncbi:MAG: ATP-binding protein [Rhodoferax sp.]
MPSPMTVTPVLRILVADDIGASRQHLCALVQELGHQAHGVASGAAALQQVLESSPDVVLLDLLMPGMDGFEVTQRIRELVTDRWLPVIVTSSLEGEEHFIHALSRGADDYLLRPISPGLLQAKLRHYERVLGLQSRLAALAQRQRDIHDNILDAVITFAADGLIDDSNLAAARMFGRNQVRLSGQQAASALGAPLPDLLSQRELSLRRSDGSLFAAELALSEWDEQGSVRYTLVVRDLTERRHIDRMKDEFLATVSHELRTPLTSVIGALSLLASGAAGELPRAAMPLAEVAKRNGERLSRLIDDILDLTKLEGNQMVLQLRAMSLDPLLREAITANQAYAERAGVVLIEDIADASPMVRVDGERFLQVMANLLSNAVKHSAGGDRVTVRLDWSDSQVRVSVRDRGPGVDPQFRSRMFEKFSQADGSDRRAVGGTGLGLYISRMLVERMGGDIGVDSTPGEGATFSVALPRADTGMEVSAPWLLHIDSDVDARRRLSDWLSPLCRVEGAGDLAQAQSLLGHVQAPIVIADPQAQGAADEFCLALKQLTAGRPVILYSDSVDQSFAGRMGLQWLRKSQAGPEELMAVLRSAMAGITRSAPS